MSDGNSDPRPTANRDSQATVGDSTRGTGNAEPTNGIVLEYVSKRYGTTTALEDVSLTIGSGTFHALVGPNGAGKSTLFGLLSGLTRPTEGSVTRTVDSVGYSFQEPRFYPDLTPRENLSVFRSMAADPPPAEWIDTLLEELRLEPAAHRRSAALSGGFRSKLDLALALVSRPQLVLLDEPLADVDDHSADRIVDFLASYRQEHPDRTVVVSTHDVAAFADALERLTVVVDGGIRFDGAPEGDVLEQYRTVLEDSTTD
ncbi:ABC transporter ATP-binding protein [Halopiger goleimassiliensis]|uniref:ABC transporter ATP-binding protein n=1 Tax=Halopiger goleimassiliensis TaxID=1293048 RepID=UPI00067781AF|nr:ABC transporter ATP-binding protein [Halopiger goleimassiliensis]